jgi:uncharacterized protein YggE
MFGRGRRKELGDREFWAVSDVSFSLRDSGPARNRALKAAGADAASQASAIAEALHDAVAQRLRQSA